MEKNKNNYTMMTDLYELTMSQVYFNSGKKDETVVFDAFFRKEPLNSGYAVMAGIDNIIEYIKDFRFSDDDIEFLRSLNQFSEEFLNYLKDLKFTGDIFAVPDGTPIFGNEPLVTVKAPLIQAQIIETALLSYLNSHICYTTAARRVVESVGGIGVMEFGARRALGPEAAIDASKCSIIGGVIGTSNVLASKRHGMPAMGTMAHSLVMEADDEYEAFLDYAKTFPDNCILLVDTYDTERIGIPNAIRIAKEYLIPNGHKLKGIRIDSGDLAYLSKKARKLLDDAGLYDTKICISDGLKPSTLESLKSQGAVIDIIGLGDNIVLPDNPRVGCVYKLAAVKKGDAFVEKIKVSNDDIKTLNPGYKRTYRFYDKDTGFALGDVMGLYDEIIPTDRYTLIDPSDTSKRQTISDYSVRELQVPIFINGELVYDDPSIFEKRDYCSREMGTIYPEVKRLEKPHKYYVDLTERLLAKKRELIEKVREQSQISGGYCKK